MQKADTELLYSYLLSNSSFEYYCTVRTKEAITLTIFLESKKDAFPVSSRCTRRLGEAASLSKRCENYRIYINAKARPRTDQGRILLEARNRQQAI